MRCESTKESASDNDSVARYFVRKLFLDGLAYWARTFKTPPFLIQVVGGLNYTELCSCVAVGGIGGGIRNLSGV